MENSRFKFRAWDQFNAVFYYSDNYKNLSEFFKAVQNCIDGGNHIVMQEYTGLKDKDKNRKDIYEGDIVSPAMVNGSLVLAEVIWSDKLSMYMVRSICKYCKESTELFFQNNIEVIGNVFENPELLEVERG